MKEITDLNILIVGCGKIATMHAKNLKARRVKLAHFARQMDKSQAFASKFGGNAHAGELETVLNTHSFDGVWICTPPNTHLEILELCLAKNLHVFCEKPLVSASTDLERLDINLLAPPLIMVGENYLYRPMLRWLEVVRDSRNLGAVTSIRVRKESFQRVSDWRQEESALVEGGVHFVALILEILNYPIFKNISISSKDSQKAFHVEAVTGSGVLVDLLYSWTNRWSLPAGLLQTSEIVFERGKVVFESNGLYAKLYDQNGQRLETRYFSSDLGGFDAMTSDALEWMRGALHAPVSTYEKAASALRFAFGTSGT